MYEYFQTSAAELGKGAKIPVLKLGDSGEVFYEMALEMVKTISAHNAQGKKTVLIVPVGPVGQYPIFVRLVNSGNVSLKNTWFINMDEYLDEHKQWIPAESPLSFRGYMERCVYSQIKPELVMPKEQRIFPDPNNPGLVPETIERLGGVDACFGGIGITGHVAFNEPEAVSAEEFLQRRTRVLEISTETRTINAVGDLSGAIAAMPRYAVTIGMQEIYSAKKIRLGVFRDWHRAVIRQAVYGDSTPTFPVSLLQSHPDTMIFTNANAAAQPY